MPTATLPQVWRGRSGREYVPAGKARLRHGELATVRKVVGRGDPIGISTLLAGAPMALKLWREGDEDSLDRLQEEARILVELSAEAADSPAPRLYDLIGDPLVTGLVVEWCPLDLERWWLEKLREPDGFGRLAAAMAEIARRVDEYHARRAGRVGADAAHGDLKPTNLLLSGEGRWLVSGFGTGPSIPPEDEVWADSRMVVANENFVAPEVLFSARMPHPAAVDAWGMGATLFALLQLKRMVDEGAALPRNGTQSPRFRTERVARMFEVYGRDPRRFAEQDLDPDHFADPLSLPDEDRRVVREALRGMLGVGADAPAREEELAKAVLEILDRAMSIDPAHRYTDCRDLAAAFEGLTRTFLALSATPGEITGVTALPDLDTVLRLAETERERNRKLSARITQLEQELAVLAGRTPAARAPSRPRRTPLWWGVALAVVLVLQAATLLAVAAVFALQWRLGAG